MKLSSFQMYETSTEALVAKPSLLRIASDLWGASSDDLKVALSATDDDINRVAATTVQQLDNALMLADKVRK